MRAICPVDHQSEEMERLLLKLSDKEALSTEQDLRLRELLELWWDEDNVCPATCDAKFCAFMRPKDWVAFHGYPHLYDLIYSFEYQDGVELKIKDWKSLEAMNANWARSPGHYKST